MLVLQKHSVRGEKKEAERMGSLTTGEAPILPVAELSVIGHLVNP